MRNLSPTLQTKLDRNVTTLAHCWRVARRDGVVMGFTDHDRDLAFANVVFRANAGLSASQTESGVGLGVAGGEAAGALSDDSLREVDLLNGVYDGAAVEIWLVDWTDVTDRVLLDVASIGEVTRGEGAFRAELRSSAHHFDQPQGRAFQRNCSADLGDARCGVDLDAPGLRATGAVVSFDGGALVVDLAQSFTTGFFSGGVLTFASGDNAGATFAIKSHRHDGSHASLTLWTQPGGAIGVGDVANLVAGCDKSPASCQTKFNNIVNFRGFPHMPGNDRVIAYPSTLAPSLDGGSFFR